jgi:glycosyltransferase involved in cell wall biosynthesis
MPVHVVHVIPTLSAGGAERVLFTNLKHLDTRRFRSTVVTLFSHGTHWAEPIRHLGVPVASLECRGPRDLTTAVVRLHRFLRMASPELLHTHLWMAGIAGRIAGRLAGVPVISSVHNMVHVPETWNDGSEVSTWKHRVMRALDRWTARLGCERMIAVSECVRQSTHRFLDFPLERTELLYNPVDVNELEGSSVRARAEFLCEAGLPSDSVVLLNVATVTAAKGLLYAVRALPAIRARFRQAHLVSVGSLDNVQWVRRLQQVASELEVADHLHVLGTRRNVPEVLRACDLFIFPSLHEGLGVALIEAMAAGCACIATATGPLPEVVSHGVDGWLVPPADADALAEAVITLLADPVRRKALGSTAAVSALARFQPEAAAERLGAIYESVVARRPSWMQSPETQSTTGTASL